MCSKYRIAAKARYRFTDGVVVIAARVVYGLSFCQFRIIQKSFSALILGIFRTPKRT
jgi:hypothetical protein